MADHDTHDHTGVTGVPDLSAHTGDTSDAHDASAISVLDTATNFTGTDVEAVLAELQDNIDGVTGAAHTTFTLGPWYINDLPGTATTQGLLMFMNTTTAVSQGGSANSDLLITEPGHVVGMIMSTDNGRTAGTATARLRIGGTGTAFNGGGCALGASATIRNSSFVAFSSGVAFAAGGAQALGVDVVTSGWTPTTADLLIWIVVALDNL